MPILAGEIVTRAAGQLVDVTHTTWSQTELLAHVGAAQRAVVQIKPEAYLVTEVMELVAGADQEAPGLVLVRVLDNRGPDGQTPGPQITRIEADILDRFDPQWSRLTRARPQPKHWMRDDPDSRRFRVYPPSTGGQKIAVLVGADPAVPTATSSPLALDARYAPALVDFVCSEALAKETDENSWNASQMFRNRFLTALGATVEAKSRVDPRAARKHLEGRSDG